MKKILVLNIGLVFFSALHAQQIKRVAPIRAKATNVWLDSLTQAQVARDTTVKKPAPKKPTNQLPEKPAAAVEVKKETLGKNK